jgi:hypothetical protein
MADLQGCSVPSYLRILDVPDRTHGGHVSLIPIEKIPIGIISPAGDIREASPASDETIHTWKPQEIPGLTEQETPIIIHLGPTCLPVRPEMACETWN